MSSIPAHLSSNDSAREQRLHEVIAAYLESIERGDTADRDLLLKREPELADELAAFFANQDHLDRLAGPPQRAALKRRSATSPDPIMNARSLCPRSCRTPPRQIRTPARAASLFATSEITSYCK